jgi:hypothetical protein
MFAPISRLYDEPYDLPADDVSLPSYNLNQNTRPHDIKLNIGFLRGWQRGFQGPGFVYDYHMTWHHYYDMGYYGLTKVLAEDIRRLSDLGLDGFVSCQVLRAYYPQGFPLYANARLLWNPEYRIEDLAPEYFAGAFGEDGGLALEYMKALSDLSGFGTFYRIWRTRTLPSDDERAEVVERLARIPDTVEKFQPVIARNLTVGAPAHQLSWKHLSVHSEMVIKLAEVLHARVEGRPAEEDDAWEELMDYIALHEDDTDGVFDIKRFQSSVERRN